MLSRVKPKASASAISSATSSIATASSSTSRAAGAEAVRALPAELRSASTATTPRSASSRETRPDALVFGVDDPSAGADLPPACSRLEVLRAAAGPRTTTRRHTWGISATTVAPSCGHSRPALDVAPVRSSWPGSSPCPSSSPRLREPGACASTCPGSTTCTTRSPLLRSAEPGASLEEIVSGLESFTAAFGRFERITVGDRGLLMLLIKNPAGANEAVRTIVDGGAPSVGCDCAERCDRRRPRRLLDLGCRLRAAARRPRAARRHGRSRCRARLAFQVRRSRPESAIEVVPSLEAALDRGLELTPPGGELVVLPTYTAMLGLRQIVSERGFVRPYWERAA